MRPTSRGIDVVAFSGTRVWSRLIRLRSRSRYSHVGLVCEIDGDEYVLEALERKGVRLVPLSVWFTWSGSVTALRFDPDVVGDVDRQRIIDFAKARLGQEYASPWQFVRSWGLITRAVCRWLGVRVDLEATRWFCSELVAAALESADARLPKAPSEMTPGDVVNLPYLEVLE
jgi:hypothetical protein